MGDVADVVIVGAGIAGASLAYELAATRRVVLLERESQPGYHSTGRSAAMLIATYGTDAVRQLTGASRPFFEQPPDGFAETPLLSPRGYLHIAREDQRSSLDAFAADARTRAPSLQRLDREGVLRLAPFIDADYVDCGLFEPDAMAIDDAALHQGYLRGFARRGGMLVTCAEVIDIDRSDERWRVKTSAGTFAAAALVNAAGAWGDELARLAGVAPIDLQPKRRTAILIDPPAVDGPPVSRWPMVSDIDEAFYLKPEGGALMVSPADETPVAPSDVQPEELDVAIAVDRYETLTGISVKRISQRWAGLRSFVSDHSPVIGFDRDAPGFFWLLGQGGFGIMTAPGVAQLAAALIEGRDLDDASERLLPKVTPDRLRRG